MDLERDRANERITSLVVVPAEGSPTKRTVTRKLSNRQLALDECAATSGEPAGGSLELPASLSCSSTPGVRSFTAKAYSIVMPKARARNLSGCASSCRPVA